MSKRACCPLEKYAMLDSEQIISGKYAKYFREEIYLQYPCPECPLKPGVRGLRSPKSLFDLSGRQVADRVLVAGKMEFWHTSARCLARRLGLPLKLAERLYRLAPLRPRGSTVPGLDSLALHAIVEAGVRAGKITPFDDPEKIVFNRSPRIRPTSMEAEHYKLSIWPEIFHECGQNGSCGSDHFDFFGCLHARVTCVRATGNHSPKTTDYSCYDDSDSEFEFCDTD